MTMGAHSKRRTRYRLHAKQGGRCFYCPHDIGVTIEQKGKPVLEHYIPRSAGGRRCVLACNTCDKAKGMIHGPEFERIIADVVSIIGEFNPVARQEIQRQCKMRNTRLQESHPARVVGEIVTKERTQRIGRLIGAVVLQSAIFKQDEGEVGREQFISEWEKQRLDVAPAPGV